jgi:hypothetical protein
MTGRLTIVFACALIFASPAAPAARVVKWFHSPSGNIGCEVASSDVRGTYAYCQTFTPLQTATLRRNGHTTVCSRGACPVGNGPVGEPTLAYGRSIRVGIFECSSAVTGVRCVVAGSGHGFAIARQGIKTF